jgi:hypothetical protein
MYEFEVNVPIKRTNDRTTMTTMSKVVKLPFVPTKGLDIIIYPQGPNLMVEEVRYNLEMASGSIYLEEIDFHFIGDVESAQLTKKFKEAGWNEIG